MRRELIGLTIEITKAENKSFLGLKGKVVDETKNTVIIQTKSGKKMVLKNQIWFKTDNEEFDGKEFIGRIEDRLRK